MNILERALAALLCLPFLTGCMGHKTAEEPETVEPDTCTVQEVEALVPESTQLTIWSTYWDCAGDIEVLQDEAEKVDEISLFAASFQNGEVTIPEPTTRMLKKIRRREQTKNKTVYLSIVNDVKENGKTTQKDTAILQKVLGTDEAAQSHAEQLVRLASENGFDGIEIDYEKIRRDLDLWQAFLKFEEKLLLLTEDAGLKVRIVLEPSTPVEQLDFPAGAEYVVMCYNLYGNGTMPGPKADFAFLQQVYEKFRVLPNISYALANGGYTWENDGTTATQCRAAEAKALAEKAGVTPQRDESSGTLYFSYTEGRKNDTVWYADEQTLAQWAKCLGEMNGEKVSISLWRL